MQSVTRFIVVTGIALGLLSMVYFLSLVMQAPLWINVVVAVACIGLFTRWAYKGAIVMPAQSATHIILNLVVLAMGLALMVYTSYPLASKHGDWDAWSFWNFHARYLADPLHWKNMFANTIGDHPDYPLLLPAANAFFMRLLGAGSYTMVPFICSFTIMLLLPVLVYSQLLGRNIIVAAAALLLFSLNTFYLGSGVAQYADIPLAFFFLCALVCINHASESPTNIALTAAALGCCIWTKNEGAILAAIFILYHAKLLFARRNRLYFMVALGIPVMVWAIFKVFYAPNNSMVTGLGAGTVHQLFMADRYALIYQHFAANLNEKFACIKWAFFAYLALCIIERRRPGRQMLLLLTCMVAYMLVYVCSVEYLEWHLATSIDRLMLQLMPAMVYVIALRFADSRLLQRKQLF